MSTTTPDQQTLMKAFIFAAYGSADEVLELREVSMPAVKDNEVLVRIRAGGCNPADWRFMRGDPYLVRLMSGLRKPRKATVLGSDMAGEVVAVGPKVTEFRPGDEVFAEVDSGGFAEYISVTEALLALKPTNLSYEQAAAVPMAAMTALQGLRKGGIQAGQRVLINGASGGVGTFGVQIAKALGAEVTGVCSARNVAMVRRIGADHVVDYTQEDFTRRDRRYDLILDTVGKRPLSDFRRALTRKGTLVAVGAGGGRLLGPGGPMLRALLLSPFVSQKLAPLAATRKKEDLHYLKELIEAGKISPVIDRTFPLNEVPAAIRYLEEGHTQGKVVITI